MMTEECIYAVPSMKHMTEVIKKSLKELSDDELDLLYSISSGASDYMLILIDEEKESR